MLDQPAMTFEALYREHYDFVWRSALRLGVPEASLDDVLQETFIVAYRQLEGFEHRSKPSTWLFAILVNVVRNHLRSRRRADRKLCALSLARELRPGASDEFESQRALATGMLAEFLVDLDELPRSVFILAELEGLSRREIAGALEVKLGIVQARLRLAREQFTARFEAGSAVPRLRDSLRRQPPRASEEQRSRHRALIIAAVAPVAPAPPILGPLGLGKLAGISLGAALCGLVALVGLTRPAQQGGRARASPGVHGPARASLSSEPGEIGGDGVEGVEGGKGFELSGARETQEPLEVASPGERRPRARSRPASERPSAPPPSPDYAALEGAREALIAGEAERALRLVATIDGRSPLGWARSVTEVAALCRLGRRDEARDVAGAWNERGDPRSIADQCW